VATAAEVLDRLQADILSGKRKSGEPLVERAIADEMGVSRTPVREALLRLRHEGLVEVKPSVGTVVRSWTTDDARARYELRRASEGVVLKWAAKRMTQAIFKRLMELCDKAEALVKEGRYDDAATCDRQFHDLLIHASQNRELIRAVTQMGTHEPLYASQALDESVFRKSNSDHRRIAELLMIPDVAAAKKVLDEHLRDGEEALIRAMEEQFVSRVQA